MKTFATMTQPRGGARSDETGAYSVATRLSSSFADPGTDLCVEIYFSGYGKIEGPKLVIYPSAPFFSAEKSWLAGDYGPDANNKLTFGVTRVPFTDSSGMTVIIRGGNVTWGQNASLFFDRPEGPHGHVASDGRIVTEGPIDGKPPLALTLRIKDRVPPGLYSLALAFTYFNG